MSDEKQVDEIEQVEESEQLLSVPEAVKDPASPLCGRVSAAWLYAAVARNAIPGVVRFGRRVYLTRAGLRRLIAAGGAP